MTATNKKKGALQFLHSSSVYQIVALLPKVLAYVLHQELLRSLGEGRHCNIFHLHQLLLEFPILVSAVHTIEILDVLRVGNSNA